MFLSLVDVKKLLETISPGFKSKDDDFFAAANKTIVPEFKKLGVLSNEDDDEKPTIESKPQQIDCNVPGCFQTFDCVTSYQTHYNSVHRYICATCKRSLPTSFLLDLHISENHDTYFEARLERGDPMFACFLEECKQVSLTPAARKEHCIKSHKFPSNFRFDHITNKHKSKTQDIDVEMSENGKVAAVTKNKPKVFSFGHSKERSFNKKCTKQNAGIENLGDLMDALDD